MDYSEKWGVDVEEAVKLALMDLKCSRDEVEVTVLEQPSKGFFGIGSKLAKVRVEKKKTEEKEAADDIYDEAAINAAKSVSESAAEQKPKEKFKDKPHTKDNNKRNRKNKNRNEKKSGEHKRDLAESSLNIEVVDKSKLQDVEEHEALDFLKDICLLYTSNSFDMTTDDPASCTEADTVFCMLISRSEAVSVRVPS